MSIAKVDTTSKKQTAALGVGARDGGRKNEEHPAKSTRPRQWRSTALLTSLYPVWSDDRRHFQGWEALALVREFERELTVELEQRKGGRS